MKLPPGLQVLPLAGLRCYSPQVRSPGGGRGGDSISLGSIVSTVRELKGRAQASSSSVVTAAYLDGLWFNSFLPLIVGTAVINSDVANNHICRHFHMTKGGFVKT